MIYRLLILFGLALVVVAVWLTLRTGTQGPATARTSGPTATDQGYAATDATVVETGADGLPMYTLQARQVQQDPDSNLVHLTTVHMTFNDASGGHWQARANQADAQQDSEQVDLMGAVDVSGIFSGSDQPAHILTDTLHVDTRTQIIRTRSHVTLTWSGYVVDARGMLVNIKDHNIKLESEVHGHFVN
jgi:LPS export ABC transporter protein LptC